MKSESWLILPNGERVDYQPDPRFIVVPGTIPFSEASRVLPGCGMIASRVPITVTTPEPDVFLSSGEVEFETTEIGADGIQRASGNPLRCGWFHLADYRPTKEEK